MTRQKTPDLHGCEPIAAVLAPSIAKAKARTLVRRHGPTMALARNADGATEWQWPFDCSEPHKNEWKWLLLDAFGTRQEAVAGVFVNQLLALCSTTWDDEGKEWVPNDGELIALLHMVSATRPKNEAQAALAAQMAATHMITMKVAKRVSDYPHDTRMIGAFANLTRAAATQFETMSTLQGRRRSVHQKITVKHEKHIHEHKHIHVEGGGERADAQPHATRGADQSEKCPSVQGSDAAGNVVLLPCGSRKSDLSHARGERLRGSKG